MNDERNQYQIIRKDARNCFVESLSDAFAIGKIHFAFATYDMTRPAGSRQTNSVHIYIASDEFLELCRKLSSGEMRQMLYTKRNSGDAKPLYQHLGGTSSDRLKKLGKPRHDGKSLSRTMQLVPGSKSDFLLVANSGPGDRNQNGLIVPKFGNSPENHVAISMSIETLSQLFLQTQLHYQAWLTAWYMNANSSRNINQNKDREVSQPMF